MLFKAFIHVVAFLVFYIFLYFWAEYNVYFVVLNASWKLLLFVFSTVLKLDLPVMCVSYLVESTINDFINSTSIFKSHFAVFLSVLTIITNVCVIISTVLYVSFFFNTVHVMFMAVFYVVWIYTSVILHNIFIIIIAAVVTILQIVICIREENRKKLYTFEKEYFFIDKIYRVIKLYLYAFIAWYNKNNNTDITKANCMENMEILIVRVSPEDIKIMLKRAWRDYINSFSKPKKILKKLIKDWKEGKISLKIHIEIDIEFVFLCLYICTCCYIFSLIVSHMWPLS